MRSTDVKHSIAGYYFQLLLACRELVLLFEKKVPDSSYVGIELGADIRVNSGTDTYVEAKFYKDSTFTRNHYAIRHSVFNFYNTFCKNGSGNFIIETNVPISKGEKNFFENWNKKSFQDIDEYVCYIKECLVCFLQAKNNL